MIVICSARCNILNCFDEVKKGEFCFLEKLHDHLHQFIFLTHLELLYRYFQFTTYDHNYLP